MFDKIIVTRNRDNTYKLEAKGLKSPLGRGELVVHRLKDFPLDIKREFDEYSGFTARHMYIKSFAHSLKIEAPILPTGRGAFCTLYTKPRRRRVRNLRSN